MLDYFRWGMKSVRILLSCNGVAGSPSIEGAGTASRLWVSNRPSFH